jgi:hypothetical protein
MSWSDAAFSEIQRIHATLPADVTFEQRVKALRDGYPFSERMGWAYKAWLKEQRKYLAKYQPVTVDTKRFPLSPMERMMARAAR